LTSRTKATGQYPKLPILVLLSVLFTLALTFVTLEIPYVIGNILRTYFPDIHPVVEPQLVEEFLNSVRPLGYACLAAVLALVIVGFVKGKKRLSSIGSIVFFLPTFGYFAVSMFFLAGVGILRILWMPFLDSSLNLLRLGDIVLLPYMVMAYPLAGALGPMGTSVKLIIGNPMATIAIGLGIFIFILGTFAWFRGRMEGRKIFDFWIYKYSRHPQYFGFLLWSYGIMLLASLAPVPMGGQNPGASLTWLIPALIIICIALLEEIKMAKMFGKSYLNYRDNSPFMLPLPRALSRLLTWPNRLLLKKDFPERRKEVLYTFIIYFVILVLLSAVVAALTGPLWMVS